MQEITVLETTLRDGSYAINFSFTVADTHALCRVLEDAGVRYIEVGHGVGLNASNKGYGTAAATDEEYMIAAREALTEAKYGMFCIPGIARIEDVDLAADQGMDFIRVGTEIDDVPSSRRFVERAKSHGMLVAANYMKSYAMKPRKFAEVVRLSESYGVDIVYLVDSAGGMFPEDVEVYFEAMRSVTDLPIGFHSHDNLCMAVANSLRMADLGASFVDSSLQGLGRSAGNAKTEQLVLALEKRAYDTGIDIFKLLRAAYKHVYPMLPAKGSMPLDMIAGYAEFHSSYMPKVLRHAGKFKVDPARLIIELCKVDKLDAPDDLLEKIASNLPVLEEGLIQDYGFSLYIGGEQDE